MKITKISHVGAISIKTVKIEYASSDRNFVIDVDLQCIMPEDGKSEVEIIAINSIKLCGVLITDTDQIGEFIDFSKRNGLTYLEDIEKEFITM